MQSRKREANPTRGRGQGRGRGRGAGQDRSTSDKPGEKTLVCTTYNDFFTGTGCAYEFNTTIIVQSALLGLETS